MNSAHFLPLIQVLELSLQAVGYLLLFCYFVSDSGGFGYIWQTLCWIWTQVDEVFVTPDKILKLSMLV